MSSNKKPLYKKTEDQILSSVFSFLDHKVTTDSKS